MTYILNQRNYIMKETNKLKEKVTNAILDKLDPDIIRDYAWECFSDDFTQWVNDDHESNYEDYRNDLD